jgi:hypothetical protein
MTFKLTPARSTAVALACALSFAASSAQAQCVTKAANATAPTADQAKWYVMETMVQVVEPGWALWPGFLAANPQHTANYKIAGYSISKEAYQCKPDGGQVTCRGSATFCKR